MYNYIKQLPKKAFQNVINMPGWHSKRRIVVIESDDWGSIRIPSKEVYQKFVSRGFQIENSEYNRLDTLESNHDLLALFEVLESHANANGTHPVITANCVVGNPDFNKIRESDFARYYFEPVTATVQNYPGRDQVIDLWKEGHQRKIFHPQFHGREHVNVIRWMNALQSRNPEIMFTFNHGTTFSGTGDYNFMEVLDYNTPDDLTYMKRSLEEGLDLFEHIVGYKSRSFIPPCYTWDSHVEETLARKEVRYLQGLFVQSVPTGSFGQYKRKYHFTGKRNRYGQYYLIRNCFFEPSLNKKNDVVGDCLSRIRLAFKWHKPAIISSHRINFMGELDPNNRLANLTLLDELLRTIVRLWPDVEFMSSDQLGDLISSER